MYNYMNIHQLLSLSPLTPATRVRASVRERCFLWLLLLLLIGAHCFAQPTTRLASCQLPYPRPATPAEVCGELRQLKRVGKFFGARCRYSGPAEFCS